MKELDDLILEIETLSKKFEKQAENHKVFCDDMQFWLETKGWEIYKIARDLRDYKEFMGGRYVA